MRAYLIRHGESTGNVTGGYYGSTDCPLTDTGRMEADQAGEAIKECLQEKSRKVILLTSPLRRAMDTASIIRKQAVNLNPAVIEPDWQEIDFGFWEGRCYEDLEKEYPDSCRALRTDWQNSSYPGGESFAVFRIRVLKAWQYWKEHALENNKDLVIVGHGGVLRVIRIFEERRSWKDFWHIKINLGEMQVLSNE